MSSNDEQVVSVKINMRCLMSVALLCIVLTCALHSHCPVSVFCQDAPSRPLQCNIQVGHFTCKTGRQAGKAHIAVEVHGAIDSETIFEHFLSRSQVLCHNPEGMHRRHHFGPIRPGSGKFWLLNATVCVWVVSHRLVDALVWVCRREGGWGGCAPWRHWSSHTRGDGVI